MCQIFVCAKMKWKVQLYPDWRPPRQGWRIIEMPNFAPAQIRTAWKAKRPQSNKGPMAALQEMVDFLAFNKIKATKDMLTAMTEQADNEWCAAEPSRCPRTAKANGGALVRQVQSEQKKVVAGAVKKSQGFVTRTRRRGCCGG